MEIVKSRRDSFVAAGVKGKERNTRSAVAAGVEFRFVRDLVLGCVDNTGFLQAGAVDEVAIRVSLVVLAVYVAVAERRFAARGDLAAELGALAVLFGELDSGFDLADRLRVALGSFSRLQTPTALTK